jgi:hypothetical protein
LKEPPIEKKHNVRRPAAAPFWRKCGEKWFEATVRRQRIAGTSDCGLRIAEWQSEINQQSIRNPHSAIRNVKSAM